MELGSEFAGVENPCESLEEVGEVVDDEDPEESLSGISSGVVVGSIFLGDNNGSISVGGGGSNFDSVGGGSGGSTGGEEEDEDGNLVEGEEAEEDVDEADSAFQEADELVVVEEEEHQVEDDPGVDKEACDDSTSDGDLENDGQNEGKDGEGQVGNSETSGMLVFVEHLYL